MILNGQIVTIFVQPVRIKISLSDRTNLYLSAAFELVSSDRKSNSMTNDSPSLNPLLQIYEKFGSNPSHFQIH